MQYLALAIRSDKSQSVSPGPAIRVILLSVPQVKPHLRLPMLDRSCQDLSIPKWLQSGIIIKPGRWESQARESISTHCSVFHSWLLTLNYSSVWPSAAYTYGSLLSEYLSLQKPTFAHLSGRPEDERRLTLFLPTHLSAAQLSPFMW